MTTAMSLLRLMLWLKQKDKDIRQDGCDGRTIYLEMWLGDGNVSGEVLGKWND